ncbi:MAG: HD-GYP domain-containing protein [Nitrospira sp.]|nr:MAG: HD-GYP domain-containing protein [Nitrospira sp.]
MRKRISIDQLKIGMKVEKLDRSWLTTPFFRHRFTITSSAQIEQLHASGVQQLDVETGDACRDSVPVKPAMPTRAESSPPIAQAIVSEQASISFAEELPAARQAYKAAKIIIQQAMEDVRMGRALNMEAVSEVVGSMADSILRNHDALTSLTRLKNFDEYTFFHSVNTSALALSVGKHLGYERAPLLQLGTGMLLHDIGKTLIPVEILNKPGRYEVHEFEIMKQHVMRGAEILSNTTGLTDMVLKPALEHHERVDGTGYPHHRSKTDISQFGLIAAIVDIYDAVTSDRCYHKGKTPHDTLQFLYQLGTQGHVDGTLVQQFVQVVGVYPVGSCVSLSTGEMAIVKEFNHHAPIRPLVVLVTDETGHRRSTPVDLDLATQRCESEQSIVSILDPAPLGIDPHTYLDREAA